MLKTYLTKTFYYLFKASQTIRDAAFNAEDKLYDEHLDRATKAPTKTPKIPNVIHDEGEEPEY